VDVLDGDVEVPADFRICGHDGQKPVIDPVRICVQEADPTQTADRAKSRQQLCKVGFFLQVASVGGRILRDEKNFLCATGDEGLRLGEDIVGRPAAGPAADGGDDAIGAAVRAAVGDLQAGGEGRGLSPAGKAGIHEKPGWSCRIGKRRTIRRFQSGQAGGDLRDVVDSQAEVDFRDFAVEGFSVALGEASGNDEAAHVPLPLQFGGRENGLYGLFLGGQDEGAGVDDDDVGNLRPPRRAETFADEDSRQNLRIDGVLRATEADDMEGPVGGAHLGIFLTRTFLGLTPSAGPTIPSVSIRSTMRAARL